MIASACGRVDNRFGGQGWRGWLRRVAASMIALVGGGGEGNFGNLVSDSSDDCLDGKPS